MFLGFQGWNPNFKWLKILKWVLDFLLMKQLLK
jgi:hypothetical protein